MFYYIRYQGRKQGPISETQLATLLSRGTVTKETEASVDEIQWKPLSAFPEFERFCHQPQRPPVVPPLSQSSSVSKVPVPVLSAGNERKPNAAMSPIESTAFKPNLLVIGFVALSVVCLALLVTVIGLVFLFRQEVPSASHLEPEIGFIEEPYFDDVPESPEPAGTGVNVAALREREEAEAKAAAEKAERERKDVEVKITSEKAKIAALPDAWSDIALPRSAGFAPIRLGETSKFLWNIRDRVKLDFVPFVDLNGEWSHIDNKPIKINKEKHKIVFFESKQDAFGKLVDAPILRFELNTSGLVYEWGTMQNYNHTEYYQKLNRFLLSKLRIEIDGKTAKEIALWTPLKYNSKQFREAQDRDGFFALSQRRDGKEFAVFPEDKSPMLLDFDEVKRGFNKFPVGTPKTFLGSSFCYAPKIPPIAGETGVITVTSKEEKDEPLKVKVGFTSGKLNDLQRQAKKIKEQIETLRKSKGMNLRGAQKERDVLLSKLAILEKSSPHHPEVLKIRTEIQKLDATLAEQKQLEGKITNLNAEYTAKNAELKEEAKKWGNVKVEAFSICLLKPGTTETDAAKPENRLPLFQVGTP